MSSQSNKSSNKLCNIMSLGQHDRCTDGQASPRISLGIRVDDMLLKAQSRLLSSPSTALLYIAAS